jgi:NADPH:quinone reductase-like Zn-dependent oxidoreductase
MVKVVRVHTPGGPEALKIEDLPVGDPGPGEARVKIEAIGLNRSEAIFREGRYIQPPGYPTLIGYEASGVVEALGEGVGNVSVGQRVSVLPMFQQGRYGVYAEAAIVPARALVPAPEGLSQTESAAIWMQYFTAMAVTEFGKAGMGDFVMIPAASSSVGLAAIQLCNWAGATPVALTRRRGKETALLAQGAAHVIATEEQDLVEEIKRITGGKGARIAFDPVGGPYVDTLAQALSEDGILFIYGSLSGQPTPYPHWPAAFKNLSLRGWVASTIWNKPDRFARGEALIRQGLREGRLKPVIDRVFKLDDIAEAHRYLESNQQVGKIVVEV